MISLSNTPVLDTKHLHLRAPQPEDFEAYTTFYRSERSSMNGGPMDRNAAWRAFAAELGHWQIRGYGLFSVVERTSNKLCGRVGLWNPEGWPEAEIGWVMYDGFEGKGYAYEAALGARAYAYDTLGWAPMISVIAPGNDRSIRLAERLGAIYERDWEAPSGKPALIYRHPVKDAA